MLNNKERNNSNVSQLLILPSHTKYMWKIANYDDGGVTFKNKYPPGFGRTLGCVWTSRLTLACCYNTRKMGVR